MQEAVAEATKSVVEIFANNWVPSWFGYAEGDKNEGQDRKGKRN